MRFSGHFARLDTGSGVVLVLLRTLRIIQNYPKTGNAYLWSLLQRHISLAIRFLQLLFSDTPVGDRDLSANLLIEHNDPLTKHTCRKRIAITK